MDPAWQFEEWKEKNTETRDAVKKNKKQLAAERDEKTKDMMRSYEKKDLAVKQRLSSMKMERTGFSHDQLPLRVMSGNSLKSRVNSQKTLFRSQKGDNRPATVNKNASLAYQMDREWQEEQEILNL